MKKRTLYFLSLIISLIFFNGSSLDAMEALGSGFRESLEASVKNSLGEVSGKLGSESFENIASKSFPQSEITAARTEVEAALNKRGLTPEQIDSRLADFDTAIKELGENWGKGFKVDASGNIIFSRAPEFDASLKSLDANFELATETFDNLSKQFDSLSIDTFKSDLVIKPADATIPTEEEIAKAEREKIAAQRTVSDYRTQTNTLRELKQTKASFEKAGKSADEIKAIDDEIAEQQKLVDSFGWGTAKGKIVEGWDNVTEWAENARLKVASIKSEQAKAFNAAKSDLYAARETMTESREAVNKAASDIKTADDTIKNNQKILDDPAATAEQTAKAKADIDAAQTAKSEAENALKTAGDDLSKAFDDYQVASKNYSEAAQSYWNASQSTLKKSFDIADVDYNLKRARNADPNAEEIIQAKETRDATFEAAKKDASIKERLKLNAKRFADDTLSINKLLEIGSLFVAGVVFMIPGLMLQFLQNQAANEALYDTIVRPQQFGGMWMQIPESLIEKSDPLKSVFLYVGITPDKDCTEDMLGADPSGSDTTCGLATEVEKKLTADNNFFVSAGGSDFESWGSNPITSTNFSGKMIHLNTGYTFFADGAPVDSLFPAEPLLSEEGADTTAYGTPSSVTSFLKKLSGVLSGDVTVEAFNPSGDWGFSFAEGPQEEDEGEGQQKKPEKGETFIKSEDILKLINPENTQCTVNGATVSPCAPILQGSLVQTITQGLGWQSSTVNVWPLKIRTDDEIEALTGTKSSLGAAAGSDEVMPAFGIYIYETSFTKLGQQLYRISSNKNTSDGKPVQPIGDYVVALDAENNIVPMRTPQIGASGSFPAFAPNPNVAKLYSLLTETATLPDGTSQEIAIDITQQTAYKDIFNQSRVLGQINKIAGWVTKALKYGPFTVGNKTLTISKNLADQGTFVYAVDPAQQDNGISGTLENESIDYLIALDETKKPVDLGTAGDTVKEILSLVTSRFYDANLKPYNKENGYPDIEFNVVKASNGSFGVVIPPTDTSNWPPSGYQLVETLGNKPGPFTAPLYTLFMDADINPYNYSPELASGTQTIPDSAQDFVDQGMIPVPYQWALKTYSSLVSPATKEIDTSYKAWKQFMITTKDQWALYLEKGPFNLTEGTAGVVPLTIEATSIPDLKKNIYIYTSPDLPGEFLVLGSGTSTTLMGEKFNPLNKGATPFILSLSTGKFYDVSSGDLVYISNASTQVTPEAALSFVASKFNVAQTSDLYNAIKQSQATVRLKRQQKEFGHAFYRFNLLLDNADADQGVFIYQDITKIPGARDMDRASLLNQIPDFLVYAEKSNSGDYNYGIEMPQILNENSRLVSLVSGILYSPQGPVGVIQLLNEPGKTMAGVLNEILKIVVDNARIYIGGESINIRPALQAAISARIASEEKASEQMLQQYKKLTREEELANDGYQLLTVADVIGINTAPLQDPPYPSLKFYNNKYYQVYPDENPITIFDYAVKNSDAKKPTIGILYQIEYASDGTTPTNVSVGTQIRQNTYEVGYTTGDLLSHARAAAGVIVAADGSQTLTIPNEQPGIDTSLIQPLPGFSDQTIANTLYQFKKYDQSAMLFVTPTGKDPYYIDIFSGTAFDTNGKPISKLSKYAKTTDGKYLLVSRESDGTISEVFYEDDNGVVKWYQLKTNGTNPKSLGVSPDGNYQSSEYIMVKMIDSTVNLKIIENKPVNPTSALPTTYKVYEQSALTYDANNNAQLYFNSPEQIFTEAGNYRTLQCISKIGKSSAERALVPSDAFVIEAADGKKTEALIWQKTQGTFESPSRGEFVVYKPTNGTYVANYTATELIPGGQTSQTNTINFEDNLVDEKIKSAYGITSYYSQITNVDIGQTHDSVDKLAAVLPANMTRLLKGLGVGLVADYRGVPQLIKVQGIQAYTTIGITNLKNFLYKDPNDVRDVIGTMGDQLKFLTLRASTSAPAANTKYLYQVGSYQLDDSGYGFASFVGAGNFIDINTGIAYDISGNPIKVIAPSDVIIIRDNIVRAGAITIPQCQMTNSCQPGQKTPTVNALTWIG